MTEAEAHQFVIRASRGMINYPRARSEAEQLRRLERGYSGMMVGGAFFLLAALTIFRTPSFRQGMSMFGLFMILGSCGMLAKLRQVRRVLEKT